MGQVRHIEPRLPIVKSNCRARCKEKEKNQPGQHNETILAHARARDNGIFGSTVIARCNDICLNRFTDQIIFARLCDFDPDDFADGQFA